jgi:hypothetical protein
VVERRQRQDTCIQRDEKALIHSPSGPAFRTRVGGRRVHKAAVADRAAVQRRVRQVRRSVGRTRHGRGRTRVLPVGRELARLWVLVPVGERVGAQRQVQRRAQVQSGDRRLELGVSAGGLLGQPRSVGAAKEGGMAGVWRQETKQSSNAGSRKKLNRQTIMQIPNSDMLQVRIFALAIRFVLGGEKASKYHASRDEDGHRG